MFEYTLKMISDPSGRQQHSHPTPTCNLTRFHGFARIWVAGKIKSLNYDHLYGQFQELSRPQTRHFKRLQKLLQGLWASEHICTSWLVTDWPVSRPGTVCHNPGKFEMIWHSLAGFGKVCIHIYTATEEVDRADFQMPRCPLFLPCEASALCQQDGLPIHPKECSLMPCSLNTPDKDPWLLAERSATKIGLLSTSVHMDFGKTCPL